jgi:hypothetical protein
VEAWLCFAIGKAKPRRNEKGEILGRRKTKAFRVKVFFIFLELIPKKK